MDKLKETLFRSVYKALTDYAEADAKLDEFRGIGTGLDGLKQIRTVRHQRFCALWDVIEQAGLEEEYEVWKNSAGTAL